MKAVVLLVSSFLYLLVSGFQTTVRRPLRPFSGAYTRGWRTAELLLCSTVNDGENEVEESRSEDDALTTVGSTAYYKGFLESPLIPAAVESEKEGDAFRQEGLEQAIKLGGSATVVLGVLFLGFMASNGLL
jgi:hypothetical protein